MHNKVSVDKSKYCTDTDISQYDWSTKQL